MSNGAKSKSIRLANTVIRASAGSGKTFQLTNRYLTLLYQGVPPERILAVTFTRKAAGEIFDRIVLRLAEAAGDDAKRIELSKFIDAPELTAEKCCKLLVSVTSALHRLRVGTLDSFFSKIAGSCSLELGLPLGWRIVEDLTDVRLRDRAISESLAGDSMQPVLTLLNLLTKGEAARSISQLIRDTVQQLYNLARETQHAAWKKVPRCKALSPEEASAARERLDTLEVSHKTIMKGIEADRHFIDERKFIDFISHGIAQKLMNGDELYCSKPITDDMREIYEPLVQLAKHHLLGRLADQTEATYNLLLHFGQHYERLKQARAALRFDDVTFALSQGKAPSAADDARVNFRLDSAIDHLLLDEFQDTSLAQWSVLRPIAQRVTTSRSGTSFFCVGDTKQAIYGWRGGLAELFDAVQSELPELQEVPLDTSFRSSQAVIDVVNRTFTRLDRHPHLESYEPAVKRWQEQFRPHTTTKANLAGYVTLETCDRIEVDRDDETAKRDDDKDLADRAFLEFAAQRIAQAYRQSPGMTIGVLTRTNLLIGALIYRLRDLEVPASEEGGNPIVDSCAVELVLSLVRLADHPSHTAAAYHVARSPLAEAFGLTENNYTRTALLSEKLRRELIDAGYGRAIYRWAQLLAPSCDVRDCSRLQQLVELAYAYQPNSTLRPSDFLEFIEQQKVSDPTSSAVRVMTVHQAKGLEFDIVFLPELDSSRTMLGQPPWVVTSRAGIGGDIDCVCRYTNDAEQKLLPASFQKMFAASSARQTSESLCVLYVAMTRAIHALHMLIKPAKPSEKNLPKTFTGLLRAALCDDSSPAVGLLYKHGQANWYEMEKERRHLAPASLAVAAPEGPTKILLAAPPTERRRGLERESPSRLEGGSAARVKQALELINPQRTLAMLRGTVIHAWFEQILWLDDGLPSDDQLLACLAKVRGVEAATDKLRRTWLTDFHAMLKQQQCVAALTRAGYAQCLPKKWSKTDVHFEACNERAFAIIDGVQMLSGRMDRVVFHRRGNQCIAADVLDYKTDTIGTAMGERLVDRVEHYRPQIEAYCRTVMQQTGLPRSQVSAALLFVGAGVFVRP